MTGELPSVPSLSDELRPQVQITPVRDVRTTLPLVLVRRSSWIGYPLSIAVAWSFVPSLFAAAGWLVSLVAMLVGFVLTDAVRKILTPPRPARRLGPHAATPEDSYKRVFSFLEDVGFEAVARDARAIVKASSTFFAGRDELLAIIDESLRHHLSFLVKAGAVLAARNGSQGGLSEWVGPRYARKIHDLLSGRARADLERWNRARAKRQGPVRIRIGTGRDFTGVEIGNLMIGDSKEFTGIRWGKLELGDRHESPLDSREGRRERASARDADAGNSQASGLVPRAHSSEEIIEENSALKEGDASGTLWQAARQSAEDIRFLRDRCEHLLVRSVQADFERTARVLKERLEREKRVDDELHAFESAR